MCSKYSVLRLPGTNMNMQFTRQIEDAVAFPVPAFSGFHKGHTNMNKQTKFFSHIKQQAAVLVPGTYKAYVFTIFLLYLQNIFMCVPINIYTICTLNMIPHDVYFCSVF